jgi:dephospho-CoA kinase
MTLRIGLTGGIGSGKSTAAKLFHQLGAPILDADQIAREIVAPGTEILKKIEHYFGTGIITSTGELHREKLRSLIFHDAEKRRWLENLLHPPIIDTLKQGVNLLNVPYAIIVIPLLIETQQQHWLDRIVVVDLPEILQLQRLLARHSLEDAEVLRKIHASQLSREKRLPHAQDVIDNSGDLKALEMQVKRLHVNYVAIAKHSGT